MMNPNAVLVHAMVSGNSGRARGWRYAHAWIEDRDTVYDYSNVTRPVIMNRNLYYAEGDVRESQLVRYDPMAALMESMQYGTYGPWDKTIVPDYKL